MPDTFLLFALIDLKPYLSFGYIVFVIITIAVIIHDKRDPVKALSWIIVISLLPVVGFIFYIVFGRNHRKQKLFSRKELSDLEQIDTLSRQQIYEINNAAVLHKPEISDNRDIITLLLNSNKALLTVHNRVKLLNDGTETFDEIRKALWSASSSIHLEYYIIEDDPLGREIADILIAKAQQGVEVRLIYDDVGSWGLGRKYIGRLRKAGVRVECFMQVVFPWLTSHVNYRNHRKILVVDGKIGFTGGINIAQRYVTGTKMGPWRDTHLRLEGEAVGMLQIVFIADWFFVSKQLLNDYPKYLPKTHVKEETMIQIATSGPDSDWASIMQAFFSAITHAQHHIYSDGGQSGCAERDRRADHDPEPFRFEGGLLGLPLVHRRTDRRQREGVPVPPGIQPFEADYDRRAVQFGRHGQYGHPQFRRQFRSVGVAVRPEDHAGAGSGVPARPRSEPHGNARLLGESPRAA